MGRSVARTPIEERKAVNAEHRRLKKASETLSKKRREQSQTITRERGKVRKIAKEAKEMLEKATVVEGSKGRVVEMESLEGVDHSIQELGDALATFKPNPGPQTEFLSAPESDCCYGGAAGGGKIVPDNGVVLTPTGWKLGIDLRGGDSILHPSGKTQTIVQIHPRVTIPKWIVEFSDNTRTEVAEEHLWEAWIGGVGVGSKKEKVFGRASARVVETRTLKEWLDRGYNPQIPVNEEIPFSSKSEGETPIDPYLLGVLLGDGCITTKQISIACHEDDKTHYKEQFKELSEVTYKSKGDIRFTGDTRKTIVNKLERLHLLGTRSTNKFIPEGYKWGSVETRYAILQGLMDTDGWSAKGKNAVYFDSTSFDLASDVAFIVRSLGGLATITSSIGSYRGKDGEKVICNVVYSLYIRHREPDKLFRMKRKQFGTFGRNLIQKRVSKVYELGEVTGRCITVSTPDGLYLTNDFIVTHNSIALLVDPLRFCHRSAHRALILRKTMPELRELIDKSRTLYPSAFPNCSFREQDKTWRFPSGAQIQFGYLDREADVYQYQGMAFSYIAFDELTHLATEYPWQYLASRLRTTDPEITCYLRATTNPGGVGAHWVKKRYIDPAPPNTPFRGKDGLIRRFIPAKLSDNPYLHKDGRYEQMLRSLDETTRRRLLDGDWNVNEGVAFPEFSRAIHVIEPFSIPSHWTRIKGADYGYTSPSAVVWVAIDPEDNTLIVYRELYQKGLTGKELGERIIQAEMNDFSNVLGVLDTAAWNRVGYTGPTIAQELNNLGCNFRPADKNRVAGKVQIHEKLKPRASGRPALQIFSTCRNLIRELESLPISESNSEDVDTHVDDHAYDALRYLVMSRPRMSTPEERLRLLVKEAGFQPFDENFGY